MEAGALSSSGLTCRLMPGAIRGRIGAGVFAKSIETLRRTFAVKFSATSREPIGTLRMTDWVSPYRWMIEFFDVRGGPHDDGVRSFRVGGQVEWTCGCNSRSTRRQLYPRYPSVKSDSPVPKRNLSTRLMASSSGLPPKVRSMRCNRVLSSVNNPKKFDATHYFLRGHEAVQSILCGLLEIAVVKDCEVLGAPSRFPSPFWIDEA